MSVKPIQSADVNHMATEMTAVAIKQGSSNNGSDSIVINTATLNQAPDNFGLDLNDLLVLANGGLPILAECGGVQGLAHALRSDIKTGLSEHETQSKFALRRSIFGENVVPRKPPNSFWELCLDALEDLMLRILIASGVFSLILNTINNPSSGWFEGLAILLAVCVCVLVTATNNWEKERQFRVLEETAEEKVVVVRGGQQFEVPSVDVNVGDLVVLAQGSAITADGVFIRGTDLSIDEAALTGESDAIKKDHDHPFLKSGTAVLDGEGVYLVTAVGVHSTRGQISASLEEESSDTPLQIRLHDLANKVGVLGAGVAILLFFVLLIFWIVDVVQNNRDAVKQLPEILNYFIMSITLVVVAVPEGLPLAVTISLAYSIKKMLKDNNLVRVLAACETMGNATMICSDKTGTLTKNEMTVVAAVLGGQLFRDRLPAPNEMNSTLCKLLIEGESLNSKVFRVPQKPNEAPGPEKFAGGNQTAASLLRYAIYLANGRYETIEEIRANTPIIKTYPFNSAKKRSSVLVNRGANESRLFVKGAVEQILTQCDYLLDARGDQQKLDDEMRAKLSRLVESMAKKGLRCIGLAYQDMGSVARTEAGEVIDHDENSESLVLLAITGIKDPLRPGVKEAVKSCQEAGIVVRMVTGDHIETAKFISRDAGILTSPNQLAITGPDFRAMTDAEKEEVIPRLRVLARSSPLDKETLVRWLKEHGECVAVTGDGTNDAPCLKEADVGLAMGIQGTDVAKKAASIVILDDNFATVVRSVMWGRSVYDGIRKFIQFQLTINIVALLVTLIGAFGTERKTPLSAVQLLWVNLIMDTFAALALATEEPSMDLLKRKPYAKNSSLISKVMWRNIFGQAVMQMIWLLVILYQGHKIWGFNDYYGTPHLTMVFNAFVFLQVFNEVNARKVQGEINVFSGAGHSSILIGVLVLTCSMQILMVEVFGPFAKTAPLNWVQWLSCVAIGFTSIPWGFLVRLIKVETTDGQINVNPKEFEIAPFPDDINQDSGANNS